MPWKIILLIFILALVIRFLYFPNNVYFGYDQARDSFVSLEILKGHLKLIGPPSSINDNLFHGPLIYYIYAPIYFLSDNNPEVVAAVFRVINSLGVISVFFIGWMLFNRNIGLISAFLFAISYEQSQYSLFISHPSLAVLPVMLFYLGLSLVIFKNRQWGLIVSALGLGLAIEFHYVHSLLVIPLAVILLTFRKFKIKYLFISLPVFLLSILSFVIAELKFNFREIKTLISQQSQVFDLGQIIPISQRWLHDNFLSLNLGFLAPLILLVAAVFTLRKERTKKQAVFLTIWFTAGFIPYIFSKSPSYYYNAGSSVSLLILGAFLIYQFMQKNKILGFAVIAITLVSNFSLIYSLNFKGPNKDIIIQPEMLTVYERGALDYIYDRAAGQQFAADALTSPLNVNTTWSYLFEWYGRNKYGYLPVWGLEAAAGFPGNLKVETDRARLPDKRFTIIEPTIGIGASHIADFFKEENYFSKVLEEKQFGPIKVQERIRI